MMTLGVLHCVLYMYETDVSQDLGVARINLTMVQSLLKHGGGGGWVHIQIPVRWVGGGKHYKLHAFVHIYIY